jgi:hypothetical protein
MNAVAAATGGRRAAIAAAAAVALAAPSAFCQEARGQEAKGPQLEISAASLPRFDNADNAARTSRLDMTTWTASNRSALGLSLGMSTPEASQAQLASPNRADFAPSMDVGVKWRYMVDGNARLDVTAYRRVIPADALTMVTTRDATYGARVEMALGRSVPKSGFVAERGFIGMQLENGARVVLRRYSGGPMVYYRSKF